MTKEQIFRFDGNVVTLTEIREVIGELLEWDARQGVSESPSWDRARRLHAMLHGDPRTGPPAMDTSPEALESGQNILRAMAAGFEAVISKELLIEPSHADRRACWEFACRMANQTYKEDDEPMH
jgi:hypothetical protein